MKSRSRFRIAALALVVVGVLSVPTVSQAHKKTYATTVTAAAKSKNQVDGTVLSTNPKCVPGRIVGLYSSTGVLEGTATTDAHGAFRIMDKSLVAGVHYVNVRKRVIRKSRRHTHKCGATQTSFVSV